MRKPLLITGLFLSSLALAGCTSPESAGSEYVGEVVAPTYSGAQLREMRMEDLAALAKVFNIEAPPEVDLVRFVSPNEWLPAQLECLTEEGFPVTSTPDGQGISGAAVRPEQADAYKLAMYICQAQYSQDPRYSAELNESQLEYLYWYYSGPLRTCLADQGHDIGTPPTFTVFLDSFSGNAWTPYGILGEQGVPGDEVLRLMGICPQAPDVDDLWPSGT
jgi:hypothetical protein